MYEIPASVSMLQDIEARQDEVLRQIAELDERVERVLAECFAFCRTGSIPNAAPQPHLAAQPQIAAQPHLALQPAAASGSIPAVKVA